MVFIHIWSFLGLIQHQIWTLISAMPLRKSKSFVLEAHLTNCRTVLAFIITNLIILKLRERLVLLCLFLNNFFFILNLIKRSF